MKEYKYTINGTKYEVAVGDIEDCVVTVNVNGEDFKVELENPAEPEKKKPVLGKAPVSSSEGDSNASAENATKAAAGSGTAVKAPLPGVITDIKVAVGDEVQVGDTVVVLEAMKMANNLEAEKAGKVTAICVKVGESVMEDDALIFIE